MEILNLTAFSKIILGSSPRAQAVLRGNDANPQLSGTVKFYPAAHGTLVAAEVFGLPPTVRENNADVKAGPFYAFHIHEGTECGSGAGDGPFAASGTHYNPTGQVHPMHAGDMPPLPGNDGYAYISFFTGRFTPREVIGRTVVIHAHADDFTTQPSGAAGMKLACGVVAEH